jgi:uncharacterized hydrophobic protein (TIGR00271 family)
MLSFLRSIPQLVANLITDERREDVGQKLRLEAYPDFGYYLLVLLSCIIATEGLLVNSAAVIIGAMLVAPLMSPIIGLGFSSLFGDTNTLQKAGTGLALGSGLAILLSAFVTWFNIQLPFFYFQIDSLPPEILSRTQPSPIDLIIALAGGLAAAFARAMPNISAALPGVAIATALMPPLCTVGIGIALRRWDVAGGAFLLFTTNAVTIAFSSTLVFSVLGFNPRRFVQGKANAQRTLFISGLLTAALLIPLTIFSIRFIQDANENRRVNAVVTEQVNLHNAELVDLQTRREGETLILEITLRTPQLYIYQDTLALQNAISVQLQRPVELTLNQVQAFALDPRIPPTFTLTFTPSPTLTNTPTETPGPSPTLTSTTTPTVIPTATSTDTPTSTPTYTPTPTRTYTPTPSLGQVVPNSFPGLKLRQFPNGPIIATLTIGEPLTILYGLEIVDGLVWVEVLDQDGRIGWIPQVYLIIFTPVPTPTVTATPTVSVSSTGSPTPAQTSSPTLPGTGSPTGSPTLSITGTTPVGASSTPTP